MLHTARCRAVLATFLKFQIITQTPPRSKSGIILSGCSSILGLPLLNSGDCTGESIAVDYITLVLLGYPGRLVGPPVLPTLPICSCYHMTYVP